jgi:protein-tyrosine phosphatase
MITKIHVQDIYKTREICNNKHDWNVLISLYDPDSLNDIKELKEDNLKNNSGVVHHVEEFNDLDETWMYRKPFTEEELESWIDDPYFNDQKGPCYKNLLNIITVGRELKAMDESFNVLVHCHAGVSRSAATAIILRYLNGMTEEEAIMATFKDRRCMWPNQLMLRLADKILDSKLYPAILLWKEEENKKPFGSNL